MVEYLFGCHAESFAFGRQLQPPFLVLVIFFREVFGAYVDSVTFVFEIHA